MDACRHEIRHFIRRLFKLRKMDYLDSYPNLVTGCAVFMTEHFIRFE